MGRPARDILTLEGAEGLSRYLDQNPQSARRVQNEMRGGSLFDRGDCGRKPSLRLPLNDIMEKDGAAGLGRYLEENPQSVRRIQDEMRDGSLFSGKRRSSVPTLKIGRLASDIMEKDGAAGLSSYLEENPQSVRRIQDEMRGGSLFGSPSRGHTTVPTVSIGRLASDILDSEGAAGLSQYLDENPLSARRIQDEMRGGSLFGGKRRSSVPEIQMGRGANDIMDTEGTAGLTRYLEQNPQSARRIQDEMRGGSLFGSVSTVSARPPAMDIMELGGAGALARYLEENPQSARRIQQEMREGSLFGGGRRRSLPEVKIARPVREILEQEGAAGLGRYLDENPQSARRIQDEMRGGSLFGGPASSNGHGSSNGHVGSGDVHYEEQYWAELAAVAVLPPMRLVAARQLFEAFDADCSGFIEFEEFFCLLKQFDPRITSKGVKKTFREVGALDLKFDPRMFCRWFDLVFGDTPDTDFNQGMRKLLAATNLANSL